MKKLASLILALAMCLALGAPAFAGETSMTGNLTTELSSVLPELKMTLPEAATIILNPYRNKVDDAVATKAIGIDKNDRLQVMNGVFSVISTTRNKVHVAATVTGSVSGNAEFASAEVTPGSAGHSVYLTLTYGLTSAANTTMAQTDVPIPDNTDPKKVTNVKVISDSETELAWDLPAAAASGAGSVQRLNMQFGGSCSDSPSADDGPWTDADTVACSFVFTVTPVTDEPMVSAVYKAGGNATTPNYGDLVIDTTQPGANYKSAATTPIVAIKGGTAGTELEALADGGDTWGGSTWDGKKLTLKCGGTTANSIGTFLGVTAAANKVLEIELHYKDAAGVEQKLMYTVKVSVIAADPAPVTPVTP